MFKIRQKSTGLFWSKTQNKWNTKGATWSSKNAIIQHLNYRNDKTNVPSSDIEVVKYEGDKVVETYPFDEFSSTHEKKKLERYKKAAAAAERDGRSIDSFKRFLKNT